MRLPCRVFYALHDEWVGLLWLVAGVAQLINGEGCIRVCWPSDLE